MALVPIVLFLGMLIQSAVGQEVLYNGIVLPETWPPRADSLTREPMPVPYLAHPPKVIPIDVGRQLLIDDFLVEETTLSRTFHAAEYHPINPMVTFDKPWEQKGKAPMAYAYSGGAWYDTSDNLFKLWYSAQLDPPDIYETRIHCLAVSKDGIHWRKPVFDVEKGTNIVLREYL